MNMFNWLLIGLAVAIVTLYLYVFISPAYKRGEKFSLPILPFLVLVILHLFAWAWIVRYVAFGIDGLMLAWAAIARLILYAGSKNR